MWWSWVELQSQALLLLLIQQRTLASTVAVCAGFLPLVLVIGWNLSLVAMAARCLARRTCAGSIKLLYAPAVSLPLSLSLDRSSAESKLK